MTMTSVQRSQSGGIPPDASVQVHSELASLGSGAAAPSWVLWSELQAIEWDELGQEPTEQYVAWQELADGPAYEYSDWEHEGRQWHIRRRAKGDPAAEWEDYYKNRDDDVFVYWEAQRTREEALRPGWKLLFQLMERLATRYGAGGVRLVVWFDSR
jgi:hypothetical protein